MKTKTILKALAFVMLLATACTREIIDDNSEKKGYAIPVTLNVTRDRDEPASKAIYNEGTKKLEFSTGDQLFVKGNDPREGGAGMFAGTLTWQSGGTFSGTIYTMNNYSGAAEDFLTAAKATAQLLPNGYETYGYYSIEESGYEASVDMNPLRALATTKALAIEQFSDEFAEYDNGFALTPRNAILNFTITGLTPEEEVTASLKYVPIVPYYELVRGDVTPNASGEAAFVMAIDGGSNINELILTVGSNEITFAGSNKGLAAGHIYNITRHATPPIANAAAEDVGKLIGADGKIYVNEDAATKAGTTAVAMICYVGEAGSADASSTTYKGLALALTDAGNSAGDAWCSQTASTCLATHYGTNDMAGIGNTDALVGDGSHNHAAASAARYYNGGTHPMGTSAWFLPSEGQWVKMTTAAGSAANLKVRAGLAGEYWSSTEHNKDYAYEYCYFNTSNPYLQSTKNNTYKVRSCLAF